MDEQQIRMWMKKGEYRKITDSSESRKVWRELYQLPSFEADERRQTVEWERERNTAAFNARIEGGRPLAWHFVVPKEKPSAEILNLFRSSPSRQLWLQRMYDFVFPKDKATQEATKEQAEYHRRIWESIAQGKTKPQTKHTYQDPRPSPLLHTIYSAPRTERTFTRWEGRSRFSDLATPEDQAMCHPADFRPDCPSAFQGLRQINGGREYQDGVVFSTNYYKWLLAVPTDQRLEGFGQQFFGMPLDEGEEGEGKWFLPSTRSGHGWVVGRELGRTKATLIFDKTTETFYLQKAKQARKSGRARADAKLPLFSLLALRGTSAGEALLRLWKESTYVAEVHEHTTTIEHLRSDPKLLQRFLNLAVRFCTQRAAGCIEYNSAVDPAVRKLTQEQRTKLTCKSSVLKVTGYEKWATKVYALLMVGARGSAHDLGWSDERYWELYRAPSSDAKYWKKDLSEEKSWAEEQEEQIIETKGYRISTTHRKRKAQELRTAVDRPREDDWESSEQLVVSSLSE